MIVPKVIVSFVRLGASATYADFGRRLVVTQTAGISVQIGVNVDIVIRGRVMIVSLKNRIFSRKIIRWEKKKYGLVRSTHRSGHTGRGGWAHDDDTILIVIIGGDRWHGSVIGETVGLVGVIGCSIGICVGGSDVTAKGSLPDHQNAASRLQHDHLPHPHRVPS